MTWPCKLSLWPAALAVLTGCAVSAPLPPPPPPAPQPLAAPALSAADIRQAEQHAYWQGYAAGRRYQKQQDAQNTPDAPSPAPVVVSPDTAAPTAAPTVATAAGTQLAATPIPSAPAPAPAASTPVQPLPPPVDSYSPKGPARPVATPLN
jgi:hypothetical protein